jgi:hypothetical protein
MTDKELLELAAKAARMEINLERQFERNELGFGHVGLWIVNGSTRWNPLTDDGDALRLAVSLGLIVDIDTEEHYTEIEFTSNYEDKSVLDGHGFDATEATRRAITLAAAQIGKEME